MSWLAVALFVSHAYAADSSADAQQQAKGLMALGQRSQAIAQLDKAASLTKSKKTQKQIQARRLLYAQQFLTSEAFQKYEEAKALSEVKRWEECVRELSAAGSGDQDNLLILKLKARCQSKQAQFDAALKSLETVLVMVPTDMEAQFERVELAQESKNFAQSLTLLEKIDPKESGHVERYAILKARALEQLKRPLEAVEVLRRDQETNLDHVEVLYELGMLYRRIPGNDWPARKMFSLFITRCKRFKDAELKERGYDELLPQAQAALSEIDRKLGV